MRLTGFRLGVNDRNYNDRNLKDLNPSASTRIIVSVNSVRLRRACECNCMRLPAQIEPRKRSLQQRTETVALSPKP